MGWVGWGHVACMGDERIQTGFWLENLKEGDSLKT